MTVEDAGLCVAEGLNHKSRALAMLFRHVYSQEATGRHPGQEKWEGARRTYAGRMRVPRALSTGADPGLGGPGRRIGPRSRTRTVSGGLAGLRRRRSIRRFGSDALAHTRPR